MIAPVVLVSYAQSRRSGMGISRLNVGSLGDQEGR